MVKIVDVKQSGDELEVTFDSNFTPDVSKNHFHVWWGEKFTVQQLGRNAEPEFGVQQGSWHRHDDYLVYLSQGAASTGARDVASGERKATFAGQTGGTIDVAYLADGVTVVGVDRRGGLHFWDAETGRRLVETWRAHAASSWRVAVHPNGQRFATAGDGGVVRVWDELSIERACEIGRPGFDEVRRRQYLGEGERSVACDWYHNGRYR
jgi:WD40 repeat protein